MSKSNIQIFLGGARDNLVKYLKEGKQETPVSINVQSSQETNLKCFKSMNNIK